MKLYLITLVHEHDEGTVVSPIVVMASSFDGAELIADKVVQRLGERLGADMDVLGIDEL